MRNDNKHKSRTKKSAKLPPISRALTIDRSVWDRGVSSVGMLLRRDKRRMCCLGIYLNACGVPKSKLFLKSLPVDVAELVPNEARWLLDERDIVNDALLASELIDANDDEEITEMQRERDIKRLFEKGNVKVEFA